MDKNRIYKTLILLVYCIPFVYLGVKGDAKMGSIAFYAPMVIGFVVLCWGAMKINNLQIIYLGNVLSLLSSYVIAKISGLESMGYYFKPFTSYSLIIVISILAFAVQLIIVYFLRNRKL